jgi:hypothetical protein
VKKRRKEEETVKQQQQNNNSKPTGMLAPNIYKGRSKLKRKQTNTSLKKLQPLSHDSNQPKTRILIV